jgi:hypothetical protein
MRERAAQARAAVRRAHVQALHLRVAVEERAQRHAATRPPADEGEHQAPARRRVVAGQAGELGVETLEAQAHAEAPLVLREKLPAGRDLRRGARRDQLEGALASDANPGSSRT